MYERCKKKVVGSWRGRRYWKRTPITDTAKTKDIEFTIIDKNEYTPC